MSQISEKENTGFLVKCYANKQIAVIMCCSEEKIRLVLNRIKNGLIQELFAK
jgi:hypothetical protein